jgi:hypothetical protein
MKFMSKATALKINLIQINYLIMRLQLLERRRKKRKSFLYQQAKALIFNYLPVFMLNKI